MSTEPTPRVVGNEVTRPMQDLLVLARRNGGEISIVEFDQTGKFVQVGSRSFGEDPETRATYLEALEDLIAERLATRESAVWVRLTRRGLDLAEALEGGDADDRSALRPEAGRSSR